MLFTRHIMIGAMAGILPHGHLLPLLPSLAVALLATVLMAPAPAQGALWGNTVVGDFPGFCLSVASSADGSTVIAAYYLDYTGQIYVSTNSGATWQAAPLPVTNGWTSVASSADGSKLVAVYDTQSHAGGIYTSTDSGAAWVPATNAAPAGYFAVASSADGTKLVALDPYSQGICTSPDFGLSWVSNYVGDSGWRSVASSADGVKLAAVAAGGIYTSTNSGATWTLTGAPTFGCQSVASSADGIKLVAVFNSASTAGIHTSADSGVSWTKTSAPSENWLAVASSADGLQLVAIVEWGPVCTSTNSGLNWTRDIEHGGFASAACSADGRKMFVGRETLLIGPAAMSISPPQLLLDLTCSSTNVVLTWPWTSAPCVVQETSDLATLNWATVTATPVSVSFGGYQLILPRTNNQSFYRLKYP